MEVLDAAQVDGEGEVVGSGWYGQVSGGGGLTVHCVKEQRVREGPRKSKQDLQYKYKSDCKPLYGFILNKAILVVVA